MESKKLGGGVIISTMIVESDYPPACAYMHTYCILLKKGGKNAHPFSAVDMALTGERAYFRIGSNLSCNLA